MSERGVGRVERSELVGNGVELHIHFVGFPSDFDEWLPLDSPRLRTHEGFPSMPSAELLEAARRLEARKGRSRCRRLLLCLVVAALVGLVHYGFFALFLLLGITLGLTINFDSSQTNLSAFTLNEPFHISE